MALLNFSKRHIPGETPPEVEALLDGFSIEAMPRTAAKIDDFRRLLPHGTRVYIAHIAGTPIADMVATARRLTAEGFEVMPHFPARIIANRDVLADWIARYQGEADVHQALVLAGGITTPVGDFDSSLQLLDTGLFDKAGFTDLHVAGHPEGNRDIDPDGGTANVDSALAWKQGFSEQSDARMAIVTQFTFAAQPILDWADGLARRGVTLPIHIGIPGPAKLQTMIKYAITCGVGPSLKVLQKRARDVSKLLTPYEPTQIITELAAHKAAHPETNIAGIHMFPLGGIQASAAWVTHHSGRANAPAALSEKDAL